MHGCVHCIYPGVHTSHLESTPVGYVAEGGELLGRFHQHYQIEVWLAVWFREPMGVFSQPQPISSKGSYTKHSTGALRGHLVDTKVTYLTSIHVWGQL